MQQMSKVHFLQVGKFDYEVKASAPITISKKWLFIYKFYTNFSTSVDLNTFSKRLLIFLLR